MRSPVEVCATDADAPLTGEIASHRAAVIDPVLDYDHRAGRVSTASAGPLQMIRLSRVATPLAHLRRPPMRLPRPGCEA